MVIYECKVVLYTNINYNVSQTVAWRPYLAHGWLPAGLHEAFWGNV